MQSMNEKSQLSHLSIKITLYYTTGLVDNVQGYKLDHETIKSRFR